MIVIRLGLYPGLRLKVIFGMSIYRPYVDTDSFHYPSEPSSVVQKPESVDFDAYVSIDLEEIVAGKSRLSVVGLSVSRFYAKMLVSQPFEVSRFLLQVGEWDKTKEPTYDDYDFDSGETSSSDEEVDYFVDVRDSKTDSNDYSGNEKRHNFRKKYKPSKGRSLQLFNRGDSATNGFINAIELPNGPYIFGLMGSLSDKEGVFGLWRALNASCLCRAATGVVTAWSTSFLASLGNVQDPQFTNLLQSGNLSTLLAISTAGCALAAALLTPLYMIRARLVSTSLVSNDQPRSLRVSIINMISSGQALAPWWVVLPTTLASTLHHLVITTAPLVISNYFLLDPFTAPKLYQVSDLFTSLLGVAVKMPFETMASRAQLKACHVNPRTLIVRPTEYNGVLSTFWCIITGEIPIASLYRGWRSEVVGLLGEWGYNALDEGKQIQQEFF